MSRESEMEDCTPDFAHLARYDLLMIVLRGRAEGWTDDEITDRILSSGFGRREDGEPAPGTAVGESLTLEEVVQRYFYPGPLSGSTKRLADGLWLHGYIRQAGSIHQPSYDAGYSQAAFDTAQVTTPETWAMVSRALGFPPPPTAEGGGEP